MKLNLKNKKRHLLRVIIPAYPAFNIYSFLADRTTALGPVSVASSAREVVGWDVEVIDENNLRRFGPVSSSGGADHEMIQKLRPADVVGFYGGLTSTIPRIFELASFYKKKGIVTIAGGQHFADETIPEALSSKIDCIVLCEGEETIKDILSALKKGEDIGSIQGIAFKEGDKITRTPDRMPIQDLDALPLPDFSLLRYANVELFPVGRVRGCGMNCEFCTVKDKPRAASVERMFEQITHTVETMGAKDFFMVDDLFGQYRTDAIRLCGMLKDYQEQIGKKLDFTVQIRLDRSKDTELLQAMREANVNTVAIGIESPIDEELKAMNKHLSAEDMLEAAHDFHRLGFFIHGMFIFGYPMQEGVTFHMPAEERIKRFKRFINKAHIDTIQVLLPVPLPGTEMRARLMKEKRVYPLEDLGWEYYDGNFPLIKPDEPLSPENMQMALRKIMGRFYSIRYIFMFVLNIFYFPHIILYFNNIRSGWKRWYRRWRNYFFRILGSGIFKSWTYQLHKGKFLEKLNAAKQHIGNAR